MTKKKTSYCQNCITITDDLYLETYNEKLFWFCLKCKFPLPKKSYDLGSKVSGKSWGHGLYKKRGTRNS